MKSVYPTSKAEEAMKNLPRTWLDAKGNLKPEALKDRVGLMQDAFLWVQEYFLDRGYSFEEVANMHRQMTRVEFVRRIVKGGALR